mmetsp:Transcript_2959/g.439  ORF Transcript_2959/g.439 Transcript_2959/m.439 type:complete len:98 (-) Transcript_2959:100-393(-)
MSLFSTYSTSYNPSFFIIISILNSGAKSTYMPSFIAIKAYNSITTIFKPVFFHTVYTGLLLVMLGTVFFLMSELFTTTAFVRFTILSKSIIYYIFLL